MVKETDCTSFIIKDFKNYFMVQYVIIVGLLLAYEIND